MYVQGIYQLEACGLKWTSIHIWGFPGGSVVKNLPVKAGDTGSIPGSGRTPGGGNGAWCYALVEGYQN